MNDIVKIGGKLAAICAVAAIVLGLVNAMTEPKIELMKIQRLEAALKRVSSGMQAGDFVPATDEPIVKGYYPLTDSQDKLVGYICQLTGMGYGGDMDIIAGYSLKGKVLSVILMGNLETPGLGKEAEKDSYMTKYIGTGDDTAVPVRKSQLSQEDADSITGASITFMAIGKALADGSNFVKKLGGE